MTLLAAILVVVGIGAAVLALVARDRRRVSNLREVLELTYLDDGPFIDARTAGTLLAATGAVAERALSGTSLLKRVAATVERSDWRVSAGELVALSAGLSVVGLVVGLTVGSPVLAVALPVVTAVTPYLLVARSVRKRRMAFEAQYPDILDLVASSLEAGQGVAQALELVVAEVPEPSASEFARVLTATRFGTPLVEALSQMSERIGSRDLEWSVQAILVQQRTGGRLAEVLRILAGVMRAREELRRELAALTAEGRLSAYVLTGLPIAFAGFLAVARPSYLHPLFSTAIGLVMVVVAAVAIVFAYLAMMRIVRIEV